jgi:hypothetical protein
MLERAFLIIALFLGLNNVTTAQLNWLPKTVTAEEWMPQLSALRAANSTNKVLLEKYELQMLIALSRYPELTETHIEFVSKKIKSNLAARPKGFNVFRHKGKRHYKVMVNLPEHARAPLDSATFNAQIGVIAHELGHIAYYETKRTPRILLDGMWYWNLNFRARFEHDTDARTIAHGAGWQLRDFSLFIQNYITDDPKYTKYKERIYMTPVEIAEMIELKSS